MKKNLLYVLCLILCLALVGCGKYESNYSLDKKVDFVKEITGKELDAKIEEISKEYITGSYTVTGKYDDGIQYYSSNGKYIVEKGEDDKLIHSEIVSSQCSTLNSDTVLRSYVKDNYAYSIESDGEQMKKYVETPYLGEIFITLNTLLNTKKLISDLKNEDLDLKIQCGYDALYNLVIDIESGKEDNIKKYRLVYKDNNLVYFCNVTKAGEKTETREVNISYGKVKLEFPKEIVFEEESKEE